MKQRVGKMFLKGFVKSFFIVLILFGVGALTYTVAMNFFGTSDDYVVIKTEEEAKSEPITTASVDGVSKNLIYCYDDDSGKITKIVLEVFHCENRRMTYITIPLRTQYTMSNILYRKLALVQPDIPQVIMLSTLSEYLNSDIVYDYGVLIMEDLLDIEVSYYTAIPMSIYKTIFVEENQASEEGVDDLPFERFSNDYLNFLKTMQTQEEISTYIEEVYPNIISNLTVTDKMNYLESYCNTPIDNISFALMEGENKNSAYIIDRALAARQIAELTSAKE
ncbi:MAG: hypothetical protein WBI07_06515 [Mobilitalea sp.]